MISLCKSAPFHHPQDDSILDELIQLHRGKVPGGSLGISAKITAAPRQQEGSAEALVYAQHRYFIVLANANWPRAPPIAALAAAAQNVARILAAPSLVNKWLQQIMQGCTSGDAQLPNALGFGIVRDQYLRLASARLYVDNGPHGTLPDLPLRWPAVEPGAAKNSSAAQTLSDLVDLAEAWQIVALEWSAGAEEVVFRQYRRLPHDTLSDSDIAAVARHVVTQVESAHKLDVRITGALRSFAVAANADAELMGSSLVTRIGTWPPKLITKLGLFIHRRMDAPLREVLLRLVRLMMRSDAAERLREWLDATANAAPSELNVVNVAVGVSTDRRLTLTAYQSHAVKEHVCTVVQNDKQIGSSSWWPPRNDSGAPAPISDGRKIARGASLSVFDGTMYDPDGHREYERARDAQCGWSAPQPADIVTRPRTTRVGRHGDAPPGFGAFLRDSWRQEYLQRDGYSLLDAGHDHPVRVPATRCALHDKRTFIFRLGPLTMEPGQTLLFSFDWPFGAEEALAARDAGGYEAGFLGVIDAHGALLGNPPVHVHHANTWRAPLPHHPLLSEWEPFRIGGESHVVGGAGDRQCRAEEGGARCAFMRLPPSTRLRWCASLLELSPRRPRG